MPEVRMPRLSDSMEEGTVVRWLVADGEVVRSGQELAEIETDKATMGFEADAEGVIRIAVGEGTAVAVGAVIAVIGEPNGEPREVSPVPPPAVPAEEGASPRAERPAAGKDGGRVNASPVAKRLAQDTGVDLSRLTGTGPGGRIVKKDVKKAAASAPADGETAKGTVTVQELSRLQQVVARRMSESKATAPHFYLEMEIDMGRAVQARARLKAAAGEGEVVPSFNDMVVKACALALKEFPRANGAYRDGKFELYSRVNIGVAVAAQDALVVPTVFDADKKGLGQIATDSRALAAKVRDGSITPPELSGGTFTVSNLGMFGIDSFSAVINAPQAGILAVGAIVERPAVRGGALVPAHLMNVTLACDHRILYGADGARFLARVRALLEEPLALAL